MYKHILVLNVRRSMAPDDKQDSEQDTNRADNRLVDNIHRTVGYNNTLADNRLVHNKRVRCSSRNKIGNLVQNTRHHKDQNKNDLDDNIDLYKHDDRPPRHFHKFPLALVHPHNHKLPRPAQPVRPQNGYNNLS
ncbi:MAG: hypothetical protein KAS58_01200 [Calditrichia bacterium]|nr:hypothetical protein [Calditrichia bacterium]